MTPRVLSCGIHLALALLLMVPAALAKDLTLPDTSLTPGKVRTLSKQTICTTKWGRDARHVSAAMKQQVFESYGLSGNQDPACVPDASGRRCEIDHLVSRELAGADDVENLWPQPYGTEPWNAARKDRLENRLHKEFCEGHITLQQAQDALRGDWRVAYKQYFGNP